MTPQELNRYSRHFLLPEIGRDGQEKLKKSAVFVVGAGGLGSPLLLYLAAAGVGRIGIIDFDPVDESNLQRQVLYVTKDIGFLKVEKAREKLIALNPYIQVEIFADRLNAKNAVSLFEKYDVIADGTDNFSTRYLTNDAGFFAKKPVVSASVLGFEGQLGVFNYFGGACYRCLYPEPPPMGTMPSCAEGGVLGVLPGIMGTLQCLEVIKVILGLGDVMSNRLLHFDALAGSFQSLETVRDQDCSLCGNKPTIVRLSEDSAFCTTMKKGESEMILQMECVELQRKINEGEDFQLLDVREDFERDICQIENSVHIPLKEVVDRYQELSDKKQIVVYCKMGGRSQKACEVLAAKGYNVANLKGGIIGWIDNVDPSMEKY